MTARFVDREVAFVQSLRRAGLPVGASESVDAARVLANLDLLDRQALRAGLAATLCKRPSHRAAFDSLFDLHFPARVGSETENSADGSVSQDPGEVGRPFAGDPAQWDRDAAREQLFGLLIDGDEAALRAFARAAVQALGRADTQPGRQSWFSYRVLRQLSPETLVARLLGALLAGQDRGGLAERVARRTVADRIAVLEQEVEAEVRRLVAEERGIEQLERSVVRPLTEQVDFLRASRLELIELRRTVHPLARRLATRLSARRRLGQRGRLDVRRTVRASLATGGVPVVTHHKPTRPHKPELVVLCDVSGSVASFAHFTLMLTSALREQFTKVRAFAFIDTCDEVTKFFGPGADMVDAMARMSSEAELVWFDGHSDYGHSFEVFEERFGDAIGPRTSLLLLGDARNNYRAPATATLARLTHRARHSYWLNPEPAAAWGSGDSAVQHYEPLVDEMVECRNVAQLAEFVSRLLPG